MNPSSFYIIYIYGYVGSGALGPIAVVTLPHHCIGAKCLVAGSADALAFGIGFGIAHAGIYSFMGRQVQAMQLAKRGQVEPCRTTEEEPAGAWSTSVFRSGWVWRRAQWHAQWPRPTWQFVAKRYRHFPHAGESLRTAQPYASPPIPPPQPPLTPPIWPPPPAQA